jgi:hypothetical protein
LLSETDVPQNLTVTSFVGALDRIGIPRGRVCRGDLGVGWFRRSTSPAAASHAERPILALVFFKSRGLLTFHMNDRRLACAGGVVGFLSGLVGSAGPLGAAAFLSLDLTLASYIATGATTAIAMHASKMFIYGHFNYGRRRMPGGLAVLW